MVCLLGTVVRASDAFEEPRACFWLRTRAESIYCVRAVTSSTQTFLSLLFQLVILTINLKNISLGS